MKPTILLVTALIFPSCGDFWGFNSSPVDGEEGETTAETADTAPDTPAEAVDGEVEGCTSNLECSDGQFCNGDEICSINGRCEAGTPRYEGTACNTPDGGAGRCRGGVCEPAGCGNGFIDAEEECDDGNDVTGDGCETDCAYSCRSNDDCLSHPGDPCVQATCIVVSSGQKCEIELLSGGDCDDGNACTISDACDNGICAGSGELLCDDDVECTADTCDPGAGCFFEPMDVLCNDNDPCTIDTCTPDEDVPRGCVNEPASGPPCDDGLFCTLTDACRDGACTGQGSPCDDGLDCTDDYCSEEVKSCASSIRPGFCLIDGACFNHGEANPGNECQACDTNTDSFAWSNVTNGASCYVCSNPCPCGPTSIPCECCNGVCGDYSGPTICPAPP